MNEKQYIETDEYGTYYYSDEAMTTRHREDGPAIEYANGSNYAGRKYWYLNDMRVNEDGSPYRA
tara:strand:- start:545 stop:736 length:192 start_codon:yes stop_codon:yes gene_type:complete